jgi:hypothetical protein
MPPTTAVTRIMPSNVKPATDKIRHQTERRFLAGFADFSLLAGCFVVMDSPFDYLKLSTKTIRSEGRGAWTARRPIAQNETNDNESPAGRHLAKTDKHFAFYRKIKRHGRPIFFGKSFCA